MSAALMTISFKDDSFVPKEGPAHKPQRRSVEFPHGQLRGPKVVPTSIGSIARRRRSVRPMRLASRRRPSLLQRSATRSSPPRARAGGEVDSVGAQAEALAGAVMDGRATGPTSRPVARRLEASGRCRCGTARSRRGMRGLGAMRRSLPTLWPAESLNISAVVRPSPDQLPR